ncbi:hypothetical protein UlMin_001367 [Ulmus minor]
MKGCRFYIAMVLVQIIYVVGNILIKMSLARGLNQLVFVAYRHIFSTILLGPSAYILERNQRPSLSISIVVKIFVLASVGTTIHLNMFYAGLAYTSPTVASALNNVIPSLTFVLALLLKMERVKIRSLRGQAKVTGTLMCIGGSLLFTFWKGGWLLKGIAEKPLININNDSTSHVNGYHKENWIKGSVLILTSHIAWSSWLILQVVVLKVYPALLSLNTMICFFASLQCCLLGLIFARNPTSWRLQLDVQLLTIVYCGVFTSGLVYFVQTWCISNKGPVFSAMFTPLQLVIVAIFSAFAFAERLHVVSLVGAFVIVVGLYCVLWGKRNDNVEDAGPAEVPKDLDEISMEDGMHLHVDESKD